MSKPTYQLFRQQPFESYGFALATILHVDTFDEVRAWINSCSGSWVADGTRYIAVGPYGDEDHGPNPQARIYKVVHRGPEVVEEDEVEDRV